MQGLAWVRRGGRGPEGQTRIDGGHQPGLEWMDLGGGRVQGLAPVRGGCGVGDEEGQAPVLDLVRTHGGGLEQGLEWMHWGGGGVESLAQLHGVQGQARLHDLVPTYGGDREVQGLAPILACRGEQGQERMHCSGGALVLARTHGGGPEVWIHGGGSGEQGLAPVHRSSRKQGLEG